jgi:hypothetical protein
MTDQVRGNELEGYTTTLPTVCYSNRSPPSPQYEAGMAWM